MSARPPIQGNLHEQLERIAHKLEALRIADYMELLEKPRKLIMTNFIAGVFRGLGFAIGTTIVFAIVVETIRRMILLNIPIISNYLIELIKLIEMHKQ